MKFNQKIFLMSFVLVTIAIYVIGYFMIQNSYKSSLDAQVQESINQINRIYDEIQLNGEVVITDIGNRYRKTDIKLEISQTDKILYSNMVDLQEEIKSKVTPNEGQVSTYIENHMLYVCSRTQIYTILMRTDLTPIFEAREEQIDFFIRISTLCSLIISVTLYIGVSMITRKIKILKQAANEILKGNYHIKVKNLGNDEFGTFAKTFNEMTSSVNENVKRITNISENRKNFIRDLTHEIRTPLTSIIGYSSLLKSGKVQDNKTIIDYARRINEEGNYMKKMSEQLMNLLLLENGQVCLTKINLSETLLSILEELSLAFPSLVIKHQIEPHIWIMSDEVLVKSLIQNLVKNAMQAYSENELPEYYGKMIVWVLLYPDATMQIIDRGKGIPQEELEKIREPFYTLKKDRNREFSGMGLGLSLCLKIIELHHGNLQIQSEVGEGTGITFSLGEKIDEDKD